MIYDCFTFYNELDLLEIRLNELNSVVDKFILVEAEASHQNKIKPLFFENNKNRFKDFLNKIIHIKVLKNEFIDNATWYNERLQRNRICEGLKNATDEDFIIISDLDEIPSAKSVIEGVKNYKMPAVFEQLYHYYYLNTQMFVDNNNYNYGSVLLKKTIFSNDTEIVRKPIKHTFEIIKNGGWHFTFLGDDKTIFNKIQNYAHDEFTYLTENIVKERLHNCVDPFGRPNYQLKLTEDINYLPKYVLDNLNKFKKYIKQ